MSISNKHNLKIKIERKPYAGGELIRVVKSFGFNDYPLKLAEISIDASLSVSLDDEKFGTGDYGDKLANLLQNAVDPAGLVKRIFSNYDIMEGVDAMSDAPFVLIRGVNSDTPLTAALVAKLRKEGWFNAPR